MSEEKFTMQEEYEKRKSAFNYGRQSIHPLSNNELINKKKIIETYMERK